MKKKQVRIPSWMGFLGLLGFLGFLPSPDGQNSQYLFFLFFGFFSWFFWGRLQKEKVDERLLENQRRAGQDMATLFALLSFFILFALSKGVSADRVLLFGSLGYALCFILAPALVLFLDRTEE